MKTFRVLVTHAGGPAAISVIKSLKCSKFKNDIKIIAVDSDSSASGLFLADEHGILPDSKFEKSWLESLFNIIKQHNNIIYAFNLHVKFSPYGNNFSPNSSLFICKIRSNI